jgi:methionyl-tRNA synthetase
LYRSLDAVRIAAALLLPIMPTKCAQLQVDTLALDSVEDVYRRSIDELAVWGLLKPGTQVPKLAPFPRRDEQVK